MVGLIQIVAVWVIIYCIIKKKKSGSQPGSGQAPNTTVNTAGTGHPANHGGMMQNQNQRNGNWRQNMSNPKRPPASVQTGPARTNVAPAQMVTKPAEDVTEEESTTAYLAKKAEEDAREHAKEKWEEEKRLREAKGGHMVAGRHLDGDPIPQGSRCVVCGYCAAENLIPMIPRTRYSCYFCREPLN